VNFSVIPNIFLKCFVSASQAELKISEVRRCLINPLRVRAELEMRSPNRDYGAEEEEEDSVVHFEV
jgi:hypothetical protein